MKITGMNPVIASKKAEGIVELFEALGFEKTHSPVVSSKIGTAAGNRMKHTDGYHVDIVSLDRDIPQDIVFTRINVDDFDEAYRLLTARGFKAATVDNILNLGFVKTVLMVSPSGIMISLMQHIREQD